MISQEHVVFAFAGITLTRAHAVGIVADRRSHLRQCSWTALGRAAAKLSTWTKFAAMAAFVVLGFAIGKGDWSNFHRHGVGLTMGLGPRPIISAHGRRADRGVLGL